MHLIELTKIVVSETRMRRSFSEEKIKELANSIAEIGLLHLPVCRKEGDAIVLCAGERRLRAITKLAQEDRGFSYFGTFIPAGMFPYSYFEELSPEQALEVELQENTIREDLTWQERALAVARLHELKQKLNPNWTDRDTLKEIRGEQGNVTEAVLWKKQLAKNLHIPEVAKAPTEKEAIKVLRRNMEQTFRAALAEKPLPKSRHRLFTADCLTVMKSMDRDEGFDVVLTDPPYGIDAHNFNAGMHVTHDYSDDWEDVKGVLQRVGQLSWELTKNQAHLYMFCAVQRFSELADLLRQVGWEVWPRPLIWVKDAGHTARVDHGPAYYYESILYGIKGGKYVQKKMTDVITIPTVKGKEHAAQKPVTLYTNLLERSLPRGVGKVLDPFCGSGTIFPAANLWNIEACGIERDPAAAGIAQLRLESTE